MVLTILSDDDLVTLLHSLNRQDIIDLQQCLGDALHYYSSGDEDGSNNNCSASNQPERTLMQRKDGSTTLFMPGSSTDGMGFKVVTLAETAKQNDSRSTLETTRSSISSMSISDNSSTLVDSSSASSIPSYPGSAAASSIAPSGVGTSPSGCLTLLDKLGVPRAFINAAELTAFRTALASTMLLNKRVNVHDLVVFGAGKQAYWHIRLSLLLRPGEIHHLNVINRDFERAVGLMQRLFRNDWPIPLKRPKNEILTPTHHEYERLLKSYLRSSSIIFTTTPSDTPLFPASILTNPEGRKKGRYIAAIGSYKPHMIELAPEIIKQAIAPSHSHSHHKIAKQGGAIIVDSVVACLKEAGELIQAGAGGRDVVEIGELVMLKRDAQARMATRTDSVSSDSSSLSDGIHVCRKNKAGKPHPEEDTGLKEWLSKGNVIYKSVGFSLMDLVVGNELVRTADARGIGTRIMNF